MSKKVEKVSKANSVDENFDDYLSCEDDEFMTKTMKVFDEEFGNPSEKVPKVLDTVKASKKHPNKKVLNTVEAPKKLPNKKVLDTVDAGSMKKDEVIAETINLTKKKTGIDSMQDPTSDVYSTDYEYGGIALIFNQNVFQNPGKYPQRHGTAKDVERLQEVLPKFGMKVEVHNDLEYSEIRDVIDDLGHATNREILKNSSCLMVFILTHGEKNNIVMAKDVGYDLYEFIERFIPNKVQVLATKPKFFFVQACRGNKLDAGQLIVPKMKRAGFDQVDSITHAEPYIHPSFADLLIAFSSHYGHYSFRNETGSWFIQDLCNVLIDTKKPADINELLTETNRRVALRKSIADGVYDEKKQISGYYSTLVRKFLLPEKSVIFPNQNE